MTDSRSKLMQIQGKWCQERQQNNQKPEAKKKQELFYTQTNTPTDGRVRCLLSSDEVFEMGLSKNGEYPT